MQQRHIARGNRGVQKVTGPWPRKNRLNQDRAAQKLRDLDADDCQNGRRCISHHMQCNSTSPQADTMQGLNELAFLNLDQGSAYRSANDRSRNKSERQRG